MDNIRPGNEEQTPDDQSVAAWDQILDEQTELYAERARRRRREFDSDIDPALAEQVARIEQQRLADGHPDSPPPVAT